MDPNRQALHCFGRLARTARARRARVTSRDLCSLRSLGGRLDWMDRMDRMDPNRGALHCFGRLARTARARRARVTSRDLCSLRSLGGRLDWMDRMDRMDPNRQALHCFGRLARTRGREGRFWHGSRSNTARPEPGTPRIGPDPMSAHQAHGAHRAHRVRQPRSAALAVDGWRERRGRDGRLWQGRRGRLSSSSCPWARTCAPADLQAPRADRG
jgi:hypothetical protein